MRQAGLVCYCSISPAHLDRLACFRPSDRGPIQHRAFAHCWLRYMSDVGVPDAWEALPGRTCTCAERLGPVRHALHPQGTAVVLSFSTSSPPRRRPTPSRGRRADSAAVRGAPPLADCTHRASPPIVCAAIVPAGPAAAARRSPCLLARRAAYSIHSTDAGVVQSCDGAARVRAPGVLSHPARK